MVNIQYKILVTGITSIHGWPIWQALEVCCAVENLMGIRPPSTKAPEADNVIAACITDKDQLRRVRDTFNPTCVIHCAGVCDLDLCEERPYWAYDLNVNGTSAVVDVFGQTCKIIYMSTDLIFSGDNRPESGYTEACKPTPISIAGKTLYQAEQTISQTAGACIIRLGLPLGDSVTGTKGAIDWIKSRLLKNRPVTLFYDELRSCIECDQISQLAPTLPTLSGLYNFGGDRAWQLYEIGAYIRDKHNVPPHLLKGICRHEELNGPPRIGNVSMNSAKLKTTLANANISISNFNAL
ncbi:MAG: sugar nucleotide-binding protein [Planctomycetota bacterium]|jgi:dTDP-4-dehydrorhamnose reductase